MIVLRLLARRDDVDRTEHLRFLQRLRAPDAGVDVIGDAAVQEVHRQHRELHARAALNEQHRIIVGDVQKFADIRLGTGQNRLEKLAAVGEFHKSAAAVLIVGEFGLGLFHDRLRQHRRTGRKVIDLHVDEPS